MSGQRKYSMELRERATRMALEARADPERVGVLLSALAASWGSILRRCVRGCVPWSRAGAMSAARSVIKRPASGRWKLKP